ncbi:hypothetical protein DFJ74DRAFT_304590 [Hyaloraphidium curvatum]|nr:hypothetical protein DFJ74DRAFT_304590 [Hyaloraphidium curvatum]
MLFLGLVPRSATPAWLARINDKLLHFSCFGLLSVLCVLAWELEDLAPVDADLDTRHWGVLLAAKRAMRTKAGLTAAGMVAMGVGSEFAQGILSPSRTFDVDDIAFNLLGIAVGIPLGALADKWYTSRLTGTDYAPV